MENLFGNLFETEKRQTKPLADRMRPERLSDFVGQESAVGAGSPLRRMIERDVLQSVLFYGPPGTGKTTLAKVIAHVTGEKFEAINAVSSGVPELRKLIAKAQEDRRNGRGRTIVFIDEIHRFNKAQQDVLLPYVENGTIVLIGATTENPFFEINSPLLSRMKVVRLEKLQAPQIQQILERAIADTERGFGNSFKAEPEALRIIADFAAGDARSALNILEQAEFMLPEDGERVLTVATLRSVIGTALQRYDKKGDQHYDIISAFIKSMRGGDADAALHYLARMIEGGEDVRFVMMTLATILLGMMTLSLYLSIGDRPLSACAAFVFALGFAARMAVSFSPTVVESGERTMLPLYGAMMLCALLCLRDVRDEGGKKKPIAAAYAVCALTAAVNFASSFMLAL